MAKLVLDVESNALAVFGQTATAMSSLNSGVDQFSKQGKDSFKAVTDEAGKFTDQVKTGSQQTTDLLGKTTAVGKSAETIRALRQEMNAYIAAAQAAGKGTQGWTDNLEKASATKSKIIDLQAVLGGISTNELKGLTQGFATVAKTGIQGFEGVIAAEAAFGVKSKETDEILTKLVALDRLSSLVGEFSLLGEKVTQLKVELAPAFELYTSANDKLKDLAKNSDLSFKGMTSGIKSFVLDGVAGMKSFATSGVTAVKSIGAAVLANPLGILLVAITAIVGGIFAWTNAAETNAKKQNEYLDELDTKYKDYYKRQGDLRKAAGLSTEETDLKALISSKVLAQQKIDNIMKSQLIGKGLNDDEQKEVDAANKVIKDSDNEITKLKIAHFKQRSDANIKAIEKDKADSAKYQAELKQYEEERDAKSIADNLKLLKEIADQKVAAISDDELREKAKAELDNSRRVTEINSSTALESTKDKALEAQKESHEKTIQDIEAKYKDKRSANELAYLAAKKERERQAAQDELDQYKDEEAAMNAVTQASFTKSIDDELSKNKKIDAERKANGQKLIDGSHQIEQELSDTLFAAQDARIQRQMAVQLQASDATHNSETASLQARLTSGKITQDQFDKAKLISDNKFAADQLAIKKKAFEDEKRLKISQIGVNLAIEISNDAIAAAQNPLNGESFGAAGIEQFAIVAGIAVARAAIQVSAIKAQKFAAGVIDLKGPGTKTSDSIPAMLSVGETVLTADETQDNINLLYGIRKNDTRLIELGIQDLIKNTGVTLSRDTPRELSQMKSEARAHEIRILLPEKDLDQEKRMESIENHIKIIAKQGGETNYVDGNGNVVIKKGSLTRIIKNKS